MGSASIIVNKKWLLDHMDDLGTAFDAVATEEEKGKHILIQSENMIQNNDHFVLKGNGMAFSLTALDEQVDTEEKDSVVHLNVGYTLDISTKQDLAAWLLQQLSAYLTILKAVELEGGQEQAEIEPE